LCHAVALEFFASKALDPPHWTLNSCFGEFRTIWVHLGPFGCLTKLGAKRAELVQYFLPRSRIEIFRNESTRSTPLDPKLIFWCISYRLGAFATIRLPYKTRGKTFQTGAKVRATKTHLVFRDERTRSTPLDPKHMFWCVSYHLRAFGTVRLPYETRGKTFRTSAKVRATKSHRSFSRRMQPIHPIGP